ncbi:MAG: response regulator transcription factor [Clostridia bacterium]|nr:response regulator transcription factor [Clostridia bacterium]
MVNILIVDDDKNIRKLMQVVLERQGFNVYTANDGVQALNVIDQVKINLAIVDIMMPNMDGYEFTKTLRDGNEDLSVLMLSAKQLPEDRKKGFLAGIDDYMAKPVDIEELVLHVKALLRRAKINDEKRIVIGEVIIDSEKMTVTKNGESQELPQKEFLLLYKLLSYPDKIFTRIQLMDEIWGMDCDTAWETLTVHISRLRKRFENFDEFEIQSIRGLGYKAVKKK